MSNNMFYCCSGDQVTKFLQAYNKGHIESDYCVHFTRLPRPYQPHAVISDGHSDPYELTFDFSHTSNDGQINRGTRLLALAVVPDLQQSVVEKSVGIALSEWGHVVVKFQRGRVVSIWTGDTDWIDELKLNLQFEELDRLEELARQKELSKQPA